MAQLQPKRIDRPDLLTNPVFWAVHFHEQLLDEFPVEDYFGVSFSDIKRFWEEELPSFVPGQPELYPCYSFKFSFPEGCTASVEYDNCPEDFGMAYFIQHASWKAPLQLCRFPSVCDWPPFRWPEAVVIADSVQGEPGRAALPLLFSGVSLTSDDDMDEVRSKLRSAWTRLGMANASRLDDIAAMLVETRRRKQRWSHDPRLGWINDAWSLRNPAHSSPEFFDKVKQFFAAIGYTGM